MKLPAEPLLAMTGGQSAAEHARALGIARETAQRIRTEGVPVRRADKLAATLGYHPRELWGSQWDRAEDAHREEYRAKKSALERARLKRISDEAWTFIERRNAQFRAQKEREF